MEKRFAICIVAAVVLIFPRWCVAKSYSMDAITVEAVVSSDGSIRVTEHITYDFHGLFSYAYREIPVKSGERVSGVGVAEDGHDLQRSEGREPRTFSVSEAESGVRIVWYYSARDEERTFAVSYTVTGVVKRFPDVTEIYYKFVGEGYDRPVGRVAVNVRLPEGVAASDVRAWAHGPLHGTVRIVAPAAVSLDVSPLPARTFWEGRILCPSEAFATLEYAGSAPRLPAVLDEEARWVEEANRVRRERAERREAAARERERRAEKARQLVPVSIVLCLAALGTWFFLYLRYGRPHPVVSRVAPGEIPSDHPPAVLSYLMNRMVSGAAVAATIFDLANRGYLEGREISVVSKGFFGKTKRQVDYRFDVVAKPLSELQPFERGLLQFVLNEAGDSNGFSVLGLRKAASKKSTTFSKFFRTWGKEVGEYCKTMRFFEPYPAGAMVINGVCGLAVMGVGVVMGVVSDPYVGIAPLVAGSIQAILTVFLSRRTAEGRRLMLAWKGFRSHLKSLGRAMGPVTLGSTDWGRYLAAAVIFGLHGKVLPNLRLEGGDGVYPVWFHGAMGVDGGVSGLVSGLSAVAAAVSTTASSAAGTGGGASGGGGGGSGGGGGGAG